jgi:RNA polymerase sigma-70 factor (ECF subfamily)
LNGVQSPADKLTSSPEALIVGLARTGNREAFGELVRRRQSWIRNLMRRLCHDPVLADDLAQQAFIQAWKDIDKLRNPLTFAAWLKQVAVNTWRQHIRRNDALLRASELEESRGATTSQASITMDLDQALAQLMDDQRLCIVLSYAEGMSHGEIANVTGFPLGTVKSHVRRGAQRLQELLSSYREDTPGDTEPKAMGESA